MTARRVAFALVAVLALYLVLVGWRGVQLIADGRPVVVLLGVGVLLLPVLAALLVWREIRFGFATEELGRALTDGDVAASGGSFDERRAAVEADPEDWRAWYLLAVAYDEGRDTKRGRAAMRHAIALHRRAAA